MTAVLSDLVALVRPGDSIRLTLKRTDKGVECALQPALSAIDPDEKDQVKRDLHAALAFPVLFVVPEGTTVEDQLSAALKKLSGPTTDALSSLDRHVAGLGDASARAKAKADDTTKAGAGKSKTAAKGKAKPGNSGAVSATDAGKATDPVSDQSAPAAAGHSDADAALTGTAASEPAASATDLFD